jgi:hypothetical protein
MELGSFGRRCKTPHPDRNRAVPARRIVSDARHLIEGLVCLHPSETGSCGTEFGEHPSNHLTAWTTPGQFTFSQPPYIQQIILVQDRPQRSAVVISSSGLNYP